MKFISNPDLPYLTLPFEWQGTPIGKNGKFINHEYPFVNSFSDLLRWQFMRNPQKEIKREEEWNLEVERNNDFMESDRDCIVWLGHASFFIRMNGVSILIDPVLFNVSLIKRKSALPVHPGSIKSLDYILISHDHRDHCDAKSLRLLAENNPEAQYLTGIRLDRLITKITKSNRIQAAGWYQQYNTQEAIEIYYVPSRHWGRRFLWDTNNNLWGGYVIKGGGKTIYFAGDSGYGSHFADLGRIFPDIDYCLIGIGAYKPEFFMGQSHLSPNDSVRAFQDTGARNMVPMHYGTFDLSDEPLGDPIRVLKKAEEKNGVKGRVRYLIPGEVEVFS